MRRTIKDAGGGTIGTHKIGPVKVCQSRYPSFAPVLCGVLQHVVADPGGYDHTSRIGRAKL